MSSQEQEKALDTNESEHAIKNFTRAPNMLVDGYKHLLPQEKWLFVCLDRLCGKEKTRYLSLRFISKRTGFSLGALAPNKKKNSVGMIRRLHEAGLIHAEIKRKNDAQGVPTGNEQYHITIVDTWSLNYAFFYGDNEECSTVEQVEEESTSPVRFPNESVLQSNSKCSTVEQACSTFDTNVRLQSNTTKDKITDNGCVVQLSSTPAPVPDALAPTTHTTLSEHEETDDRDTCRGDTANTDRHQQRPAVPDSSGMDAHLQHPTHTPPETTQHPPAAQPSYSQQPAQPDEAMTIGKGVNASIEQPEHAKSGGKRAKKPPTVPVPFVCDKEAVRALIVAGRRGQRLVEKGEIIQENRAIIALAQAYTLEQLQDIHRYLVTRDRYYSQLANKFRVGGVALAKQAPSVLAILDLEQTTGVQEVSTPPGRIIQMPQQRQPGRNYSSFTDPDFKPEDFENEFYHQFEPRMAKAVQ